MDLKELPSIIKETQYKENVLLQMAVLKAYLKQILQYINPKGRPQTLYFK